MINGLEIIKDKNEIIRKKIKIERAIVQKFLTESMSNSSLIILKNEIYKVHLLSKIIINFLKDYKKKELLLKDLLDYLSEVNDTKIEISYLEFLLDVIKNYFKVDIPNTYTIPNFLKFL